jgi:hypothetical protein
MRQPWNDYRSAAIGRSVSGFLTLKLAPNADLIPTDPEHITIGQTA